VAADKAQQQSGDERRDGDAECGPSHTSPRPVRSTAPHFDHVSITGSVRRSPQRARPVGRKTLTVRGRFHLLTIDRGVVHWPAGLRPAEPWRPGRRQFRVPGIG
jgi:hypothetical protein